MPAKHALRCKLGRLFLTKPVQPPLASPENYDHSLAHADIQSEPQQGHGSPSLAVDVQDICVPISYIREKDHRQSS